MLSLQRLAAMGLTFVASLAAGACASASSQGAPAIPDGRTETVVYFIRHGEKMSETARDPDLSAKGRARAESLAVALRDSGVNMIITSDLRRTQQTAAPLAKLRHIRPTVIAISPTVEAHIDRIASTIKSKQGATILVVGHNNTVGRIVERIGGGAIGDLCVDEYSNLIIVSLNKGKATKTLFENYGAPDPPAQPDCVHMKDR